MLGAPPNNPEVGKPFSQTLEVTGGAAPYTWSIEDGTLCPGVSLNPATGEVSGVPQEKGDFFVTVKVTDADKDHDQQYFVFSIPAGLPAICNIFVSPINLHFESGGGSQDFIVMKYPPSSISPEQLPISTSVTPIPQESDSQTKCADLDWLTVSVVNDRTPGHVQVEVNSGPMVPGTCLANIVVNGCDATRGTVLVNLSVGETWSSFSMYEDMFLFEPDSSGKYDVVNVEISSTGPPFSFGAEASTLEGDWLTVTPASAITPERLHISVIPSGLQPGWHTGTIRLTSDIASVSPREIRVELFVEEPMLPAFVLGDSTLAFVHDSTGGPPAPMQLSVGSSGAIIPFSATASSPGGWLSVSPESGESPATLNVAVNPAGLAPGTHVGSITLTSEVASNSPQTVSVSLTVTGLPMFAWIEPSLSFTHNRSTGSSPPLPRMLVVGSNGAPFTFTAAATSENNWLSVTPGAATTPATLSVSADPANTLPGTYRGRVILSSDGANNSPQAVEVTLTVTGLPAFTLSESSLAFEHIIGQPIPAPIVLAASSTGSALSFRAITASDDGWLTVSPTAGITPTTLNVSVDPEHLSPGVYSGTLTLSSDDASNSPQTVNVTLTVTTPPVLDATPSSLSFEAREAGGPPPPQKLAIESSGEPLAFTTRVSSGVNWLSVNPESGQTGTELNVSVDPAGLDRGTHTASVVITSPGASNSPLNIQVTILVMSSPQISENGIVHGATFTTDHGYAPNTFGTLMGFNLASVTQNWAGFFDGDMAPTVLGGTSIIVNGKLAFISFTGTAAYLGRTEDQVNFVFPDEEARGPVTVQVKTPDGLSNSVVVNLAPRAPAFFAHVDPGGTMFVAALQNDFTAYVGPPDLFGGRPAGLPVQPAKSGDWVRLYATGFGTTNPSVPAGKIPNIAAPFSSPVRIFFGQVEVEADDVLFAGLSEFVGVQQVVVKVPSLGSGNYEVTAEIDGYRTQNSVYFPIQGP
jgi:uncharacterized protein (TIGR03437 family)